MAKIEIEEETLGVILEKQRYFLAAAVSGWSFFLMVLVILVAR